MNARAAFIVRTCAAVLCALPLFAVVAGYDVAIYGAPMTLPLCVPCVLGLLFFIDAAHDAKQHTRRK